MRIDDVLGGVFAFREGGLVVALRGYFDDSGSHRDSEIAVWAGWIGSTAQWDAVESAWANILKERGLGPFKMSECVSELAGDYGNRAERDSLIHDLRSLLLDSKLTGCGAGVVLKAWERAPPWVIGPIGNPNRAAAAYCVSAVNEVLERYRARMSAPLALFFDAGAQGRDIIQIMNSSLNELAGRADSVAFIQVANSPALQAADMLAWELRNDMRNREAHGATRAFRPHFARIVEQNNLNFIAMNDESVDAMYRRGPPPSWKGPSS